MKQGRGSPRYFSSASVATCAAAIVTCLLLGSPASWAGFKEGQAAFVRQDYAQAMREWSAAAERGDPRSQYRLAVLFELGKGTAKSIPDALKWVRKAAENGDADAQFSLGTRLLRGEEFPMDPVQGAKWIARGIASANHGDPEAQFRLSLLYRAGLYVQRDEVIAHGWLASAADLGNASAQAEMGRYYLTGRGVDKNETEARKWLEKAAAQGEKNAIAMLMPMLSKDFEAAKDDATAVQPLFKGAELDDTQAQYYLAAAYWIGRGVERDSIRACTWALIAGAKPNQLSDLFEGVEGRVSVAQLGEASRAADAWRQSHPRAPVDPRSHD